MLKYRFISAAILIPCIILILFSSSLLGYKLIIFLTCMLSAWEWGKLSNLSPTAKRTWLLSMCILLTIMWRASTHQSFFNINNNQYIAYTILTWWMIASLLILSYPHSAMLWNKFITIRLIFGILIIIPFFWGSLILRNYGQNEDPHIGSWLLLYSMTLVWGMDSFSYIIGYNFGQHQAVPQLSPNKTWEGYIGGTLITIIILLFFMKYIPIKMSSIKLFLYSIIIILSSVLGDLTESMFKRESRVKDSGQLIPGHGGILDTIDGLYSSIPIFASLILII